MKKFNFINQYFKHCRIITAINNYSWGVLRRTTYANKNICFSTSSTLKNNYSNFQNKNNFNVDIKNKHGWYPWYSSVEYRIIDASALRESLSLFFDYYKSNFKHKYFEIIFKIKLDNGDVRSCSTVQIAHIDDFDKLYSTFSYIFTLEDIYDEMSETHSIGTAFEDNYPIGNIIFNFKPISNINKTKYENFITKEDKYNAFKYEEGRDYIKYFKYKNCSIPAHMDLSFWPNINFSDDYTNAHAMINVKIDDNTSYVIDLIIIIQKSSYYVTMRNKNNILFSFKDESLNNNRDLTCFRRTIYEKGDKKIYYFDSGKVDYYFKNKKVSYIEKISKDLVNLNKPKILTLDLETRVNKDNTMVPICMSIFDGKECSSFTFNPDHWEDTMMEGLKKIMKRKYASYKVYIHNFSYFDAMFMVDVLSKLGDVDLLKRDNKIIKLTFKFDTEGGRKCNLYFLDSMLLLPDSLDKLSKSFNVEDKKSIFPLMFLNKDDFSLDYVGNVPEYKYFPKAFTKNFTIDDYKNYCKLYTNWNLRDELIKYCEIDTKALYQIIFKFQEEIYKIFQVDITKYPTLPSLSFGIYRSNFIKSNKLIPNILSKLHYTIKQSYFGGITETYKGFGKNINSYDVNSLYPYSMYSFPMPVGVPRYFSGNVRKYAKDPYGFFKVKVYAPLTLNKPFLPVRIKTDSGLRTIFPVGSWEGWYFSEEIKNAEKYGYRFEILEGYLFDKGYIFKEFIEKLYKMKSESDSSDPKYYIAKLLMNSLYGRFGLNPVLEKVLIITSDEADKIVAKEKNVNIIPLLSGKVIVSYDVNETELDIRNISVPISSAISSYSRIVMSEYMNKYSDNLYAIDTDGIKINCELSKDKIDSKILGKMKYEFTFKEAAFPAPKVYGGLLTKPYKNSTHELVKIKGLKNPISYYVFKSIVNKNIMLKIDQEKWKRNISKSTILVTSESYSLRLTENKRELIYDNFGNFVDSIPLYLNNGKIEKRNPSLLYYLNAPKQK